MIHNKIESPFLFIYECSNSRFFLLEMVGLRSMPLSVVGVFCIINGYFEYVYRILCICLYIWSYFKDMFEYVFQTCPRNVTNSRTYLFEMFWDVWSYMVLRRVAFVGWDVAEAPLGSTQCSTTTSARCGHCLAIIRDWCRSRVLAKRENLASNRRRSGGSDLLQMLRNSIPFTVSRFGCFSAMSVGWLTRSKVCL